ncbi:unnamed protein product [Peronospora belbahrii]|uniref:Sensor domain-containing protein n=1 Tax=Peronospora belbahrii TaxID=622444 RepID=A0AAU9KKY9_9STRA|nr:unnamed protein product [Peronospora belbahrii]CAH0514470.1 unnamed protein product [Peronospora belbahrii]
MKTSVFQTIKVLIFLVLNYLFASAGFIVILFGVAFSLGSLALCCLGVVMFQGLLYLAPLLARLDIVLHNFIEPMENKLYGQIPHYGANGSYLTRPSLAVLLYFSTAKLGVGVLSAMVVVIPLTMPIHALMSPIFRNEYFSDGWFNLTIFVVVATALLVSGFAAMPHVARLSCVTTRLLCREVYSTIYMRNYVPSTMEEPLELTTYGTNQLVEHV